MKQATIFTLFGFQYNITYKSFDYTTSYYVFYNVEGKRGDTDIKVSSLRVPIQNTVLELSIKEY